MKQIFKTLFSVFAVFILLFLSLPIQANAEENTETPSYVFCTFKANVDPRIKAKDSTIKINIFNTDLKQPFTITLYAGSDYIAKQNLPKGHYIYSTTRVQYFEGVFSADNFEFDAQGIAVDVPAITIGDPNYSGEIDTSDPLVGGMLDREKIDEYVKEKGLNPIDWDDIDADAQEIIDEYIRTEGGTKPDPEDPNISNPSEPSEPSNPDSSDPTDPNVSEPTPPTESSQPEITNPEDEPDTAEPLSFTTILIFIGIVAVVVIALVIRYKNNQL